MRMHHKSPVTFLPTGAPGAKRTWGDLSLLPVCLCFERLNTRVQAPSPRQQKQAGEDGEEKKI